MSESERLKLLATLAGFDQLAPFARKAGLEVGTAQKQYNRGSIPKKAAAKYVEAARNLGVKDVTEEWLLYNRGPTPRVQNAADPPVHKNVISPDIELRHFDMSQSTLVPLWKAVEADGMEAGASVHISKNLDDSVLGPTGLRHFKSAFAVKIWDETNAPWLNMGALIFSDRSVARPGDWVIFGSREVATGLRDAVVAVFLGRDIGLWRVQIGRSETTLPSDKFKIAWRVVHITP